MRPATAPKSRSWLRVFAFCVAALTLGVSAQAEDRFLPVRSAYQVSTNVDAGELVVRFDIAPDYYLYRSRLGFESATPGVQLGAPALPVGIDHEDEYFGRQVIYRGPTTVGLPVTFDGASRDFDLRVKLQGCADAGLCYPPQTWTVHVAWQTATDAPASSATVAGIAAPSAATATPAAPARKGGGFNLRSLLGSGAKSDADFLPVDQAFALSPQSPSRDVVRLQWLIADDYYLYRDKVTVRTSTPGVVLGTPSIPGGELKHDEYFGDQVVFHGEMLATVPVSTAATVSEIPLEVTYQGCAEEGLCYPPVRKSLVVQLASTATAVAGVAAARPPAERSEQDVLASKIREGNLFAVLASFFGFGLLLAFTPCVLPMVPILSGIIVGAGQGRPVARGRAFALSLAYVLGMALTYTVAGAAFAAAGQQAQAFFQKPWIIVAFAALFVWLALGMLGLFDLQVPGWLQSRVAALSNRQKQGTLAGTAIMGALSSLIVTACVAPPLVASLAVIGQSGDVFRGGAALFTLSLGMGAPLLLVGASAGELLPRAGAWMETVKRAFGVLLLGVAIWMLSRILPGPVTLAAWAALAFVVGYCLLVLGGRDVRRGTDVVRRGFGALAVVYGTLLLIGALAGRSDPLQPLANLGAVAGNRPAGVEAGHEGVTFKRIKSVADFERELDAARDAGRPVMLDFYADWCVSCKEMEKYTFTDPSVQRALGSAVLLQADVTANDDADQALLQHFGILGPPTIVFFGADGREREAARVVGFKPAEEFAPHVDRAFANLGSST